MITMTRIICTEIRCARYVFAASNTDTFTAVGVLPNDLLQAGADTEEVVGELLQIGCCSSPIDSTIQTGRVWGVTRFGPLPLLMPGIC